MAENRHEQQEGAADAPRASQRLALGEDAFRSFCEGAYEGIIVAEVGTKQLIYANPAFARMFGYTHDEILGLTVADLHPPEAMPSVERDFRMLGHSELEKSIQPCLRKDGSLFTGQIRPWPFTMDGRLCAAGFFEDITEAKQLEEDLQERVKELKCLESISNAIQSEQGLEHVFRVTVDALSEAFLYPDIACARIMLRKDSWQTDTFCQTEWCLSAGLKVRDRTVGAVEVFYLEDRPEKDEGPFLSEERRMLRLCAERLEHFIENIWSENELRDSHQRLELALEGGELGLWDWNPQTDAVVYSDRWARMLGYSPAEIKSSVDFFKQHVHPDDLPAVLERLEGHVEGRLPVYESEYRMRTEAGEWRWMLDRGKVAMRDDDGRPVRVTGVISDITERKRYENSLETIAWMRDKDSGSTPEPRVPHYGDVTTLNTDRTIRDSVGLETLKAMGDDLMRLLDTSVAVYEKNGDYAYGSFVSEWCSQMDGASRKLCQTADNREALDCGRWLCHENCWNHSARAAIDSGKPTDIACVGGIHLYGMPIFADEEVVGAINIGYGDPPRDDATLQHLAHKFGVDIETLRQAAATFKPRPPFIVEAAKARLRLVAKQIGQMVEHHRAQEALRASELRYRQIFNAIQDVYYEVDPAGRILEASPSIEILSGYSREELLGKSMNDLYAQPKRREALLTEIQEKGRVADYEIELRDKDGTIRSCSITATLVTDDENPARLVGSLRDITERKLAEEEVRSLERRNRALLDYSPVCHKIVDLDLNLQYMNAMGFRLLKLEENDDLYGRSYPFAFFPEASRQQLIDELQRVRDTGQRVGFESPACDAEGNEFWLYHTLIPVPDDTGATQFITVVSADITERKQASEQIADSLALIKESQAAGHIGSWEYDIAEDRVSWSDEMYRIAGIKIGAPLPGWEELCSTFLQDGERLNAAVQRAIQQGEPHEEDFRILRPDGTVRWGRVQGSPVQDDAGKVVRLIGTMQDITERKQAEQALLESEQRFQRMLEVVPDMISIHSLEMDILYSNWQGFAAVPEANRLVNTKCYETYRGLDEICPDCRARRVLESGKPLHEEVRLPDGRWVDLRVIPLLGKDNEVEMFMEWVRDISVRKAAEETLRESEKRFATAFQYSPAPLVLSEVDTGLFLDVNDRWVEMLEFSRDEQIGRTSKEVGIWDDPEDRDRIVAKLRCDGRFRDEPIRFKTKSGKRIIALWSAEIVDLSGKQVMLSMITDITQLRQAEEERERLGTQLQQAHKMESVGRLAGGVAHDFNNMLSVILGHAGIMSDGLPDDSPLRENLDEIRMAADRSASLTRQLLAFARKQTIAPQNLDLNETIDSMLKMLQRLIGEDIDLLWKPTVPLDTVRIDPGQVDQILANLAVNARDAIGPTHGKLTIETRNARFDEAYCADHAGFVPGEYVMLAVSDDGRGMDEEIHANIFEPFFTTKDVGEGTGLGLATVYGIVKQNNGFINVYSEPGQGTTFRIYLPRHQAKATPLPVNGPDRPSRGGHETILLVEDEPAILKMTALLLKQIGYQVVGASTPGQAVRLATEHVGDIHVLMTDVVMPEMNGRDLAKNILSLYPDVKCLFMSGYTANVIAHRGVLDEGVHFIQKPFSRQDLAVKVLEVLGCE